jgi:hypothetical protein
MISGNLHADVEQLYLDSGVVKVADFGLSKSLVPVDRHGQMSMSLTQVRQGRRMKRVHLVYVRCCCMLCPYCQMSMSLTQVRLQGHEQPSQQTQES